MFIGKQFLTCLLVISYIFTSAFSPIKQTSPQEYDVVIFGAGTGGVSAAIQAARMGVSVLLVEETDWIGGQMTAAGVSTMDGNYGYWESGLYKEFMTNIKSYYNQIGVPIYGCYFKTTTYCFEPNVGQTILLSMIQAEPNITLLKETSAITIQKTNNSISLISLSNGIQVIPKIVIDATEYGDITSLSGASYRIGNRTGDTYSEQSCIQDITYVAILKKYQTIPPELLITTPPPGYNQSIEDYFKSMISETGYSSWTGLLPVKWDVHIKYRAIPNSPQYVQGEVTKTALNWANDYNRTTLVNPPNKLSSKYLYDIQYRNETNCYAKLRTIQLIYFIQSYLGKPWAISTDEGYNTQYNRDHSCPLSIIPQAYKQIEYNLPPIPYVRESKRGVGILTVTGNNIKRSGNPSVPSSTYTSSIAVGNYGFDLHNCNAQLDLDLGDSTNDILSQEGGFQIPIGALISADVVNLIFAEKNISVSRVANGATRLQPITMLTGQAAGALAAISVAKNINPSTSVTLDVQKVLVESSSPISLFLDVPKTSYFFKSTNLIYARGIISGYSPTRFAGGDYLTRGQMAVIIGKAFSISPVVPSGIFTDVPTTDIFAPYIESIYLAGITSGCSNSPKMYCPNNYITRAQMAVFLLRGWSNINSSVNAIVYDTSSYQDVGTNHWAFRYIETLYRKNVILYCTSQNFCPEVNITREEAGFLLDSVIKSEESV